MAGRRKRKGGRGEWQSSARGEHEPVPHLGHSGGTTPHTPRDGEWQSSARGEHEPVPHLGHSGGTTPHTPRDGEWQSSARGEHEPVPHLGQTHRGGSARDREVPADEVGPDADPEQFARAIVLKQLALQPRTKMELARTLSRRGVPDEVAGHVLGRFSEVGLIDDAAFAQAWVESRHTGRGLARRALAYELRRRGVDDRDVDAAVEQLSPDTERETARALVARKLASTRNLEPHVRLRRLAGMLARKGYPSTIALTVVREALAAEGADAHLDGYLDAFDTDDPDDLP